MAAIVRRRVLTPDCLRQRGKPQSRAHAAASAGTCHSRGSWREQARSDRVLLHRKSAVVSGRDGRWNHRFDVDHGGRGFAGARTHCEARRSLGRYQGRLVFCRHVRTHDASVRDIACLARVPRRSAAILERRQPRQYGFPARRANSRRAGERRGGAGNPAGDWIRPLPEQSVSHDDDTARDLREITFWSPNSRCRLPNIRRPRQWSASSAACRISSPLLRVSATSPPLPCFL